MKDINILDKVLKDIKDPKIRQSLKSDLPERAVFGSGGLSAFLGTQELPPEAYGTEYTNLPDPFRKAIEEVADMDLKNLRTAKGQGKLESALLKQKVPLKDIQPFMRSVRESAEVWLGKDTQAFMKQAAGLESAKQAPSKVGHIADLLKVNKQGVPKIKTALKVLGKGLRGLNSAQKLGAAAVLGGLLTKAVDVGVDLTTDKEPERTFKFKEAAKKTKAPESIDDLRRAYENWEPGE